MMFETPASRIDLRQLPVFAPDPALWSRIAEAHRQQRRWRHAGLAAAATLLLGLGAAFLMQPVPAPESAWAAAQRESQQLESEWLQLADGGRKPAIGVSQLRSIDGALQAAYDRGAQGEEILPLWQRRNAALRDLIAGFRDAGASGTTLVTRI